MFRTGSPYSPFFTSGLLYDSTVPRRGSLPADSRPSAFYFTLQPTSDYRSFLSLDLAESLSLRSSTLRPKDPAKVFTFAQIPETELPPPHPSLRLRRSRDSLRTIPSPKPAPSITLPDVPKPHSPSPSTPPRLPSIAPSPPLGLSLECASHSAPALVVSRTETPEDLVELAKRNSMSSVSPTVRKINRSHALARLEGRTNSTRRKPKPIKRNFMSMSDEESEGDDHGDDEFQNAANPRRFALSVINEPEDLVLPPALPLSEPKTAPIGGRFPSEVRSKSTSPRKRQTTAKDWFPLKSFIDLQAGDDDNTKFSWRSLIEVARVS
ncbi:hypothetical protein C0995_008481 [Termitomyces sp. Mi166|nr:hypothetical protein C0995_008481 [Termitomyces sp. Mi166\